MQSPTKPDINDPPLVLIVDDDEFIREALSDLLQSVSIESKSFSSTKELLDTQLPDRVGCLILDVRLPGLSGLDLQDELMNRGNTMSIIFMTGYGDIPMTVRAMKAGAVDFLTKPFRDQDMVDAVTVAVEADRERRKTIAQASKVETLAETLTPREREVLTGIIAGSMNKQIAWELGITETTVKLHRGKVMRKMQARTLADLIRKSELLQKP